MKSPLRKRIPRELKTDFGKYLVIFLFLTAMIWGAAFVAQSVSMDYIGPFTFICLRSVIGGLFLIPVIMVIDNIRKKRRSESVKTASDNGINSFQKMQAEEENLNVMQDVSAIMQKLATLAAHS